jgi:hypothetical protein
LTETGFENDVKFEFLFNKLSIENIPVLVELVGVVADDSMIVAKLRFESSKAELVIRESGKIGVCAQCIFCPIFDNYFFSAK